MRIFGWKELVLMKILDDSQLQIIIRRDMQGLGLKSICILGVSTSAST